MVVGVRGVPVGGGHMTQQPGLGLCMRLRTTSSSLIPSTGGFSLIHTFIVREGSSLIPSMGLILFPVQEGLVSFPVWVGLLSFPVQEGLVSFPVWVGLLSFPVQEGLVSFPVWVGLVSFPVQEGLVSFIHS